MSDKLEHHAFMQAGVRRAYHLGGSNTSNRRMLFLSGLYHTPSAWAGQRRFFSRFGQVFVDYRGVGDSRVATEAPFHFDDVVDDIAAIATHVSTGRYVIVGFSTGGMFALRLGQRYPQLVQRLILLNTGLRIGLQAQNMVAAVRDLMLHGADTRSLFRILYTWNHSEPYLEKVRSLEPQIIDTYCEFNDRAGLALLLRAINERPCLEESARSISAPTLIINSDGDQVFPVQYQSELFRCISSADCHVLRGCGHSAFVEQSREVNRLMDDFLRQDLVV